MKENKKVRTIVFYKEYFTEFFLKQRQKVKDKIIWTFDLIEIIDKVPETYLNPDFAIELYCNSQLLQIQAFD